MNTTIRGMKTITRSGNRTTIWGCSHCRWSYAFPQVGVWGHTSIRARLGLVHMAYGKHNCAKFA